MAKRHRSMLIVGPVQMVTLDALKGGEMSGKELRARLKAEGVERTTVAFYLAMQRLVDAGTVTARKMPGKVKETRYALTEEGRNTLACVRDFAERLLQSVLIPR